MSLTTLPLPGGPVDGAVGLLPWIAVGDVRVAPVRVGAVAGRGTGFSDPACAGNLGQGLLERFRLVFDYPRRRVAAIERR